MSPHDLTVKLFLQLAVILAACRFAAGSGGGSARPRW